IWHDLAKRRKWPSQYRGKQRSHPISAAILPKIEHEDTRVAASGPLEHLRMAKRMHRVAIAGEPTVLNGLAGEFVLFGGVFGACRPVDQVYQVMQMLLGQRHQELRILASLELIGHLFKKTGEGRAYLVNLLVAAGVVDSTTRIQNLLHPYHDFLKIFRKRAGRGP